MIHRVKNKIGVVVCKLVRLCVIESACISSLTLGHYYHYYSSCYVNGNNSFHSYLLGIEEEYKNFSALDTAWCMIVA
jgi:hypothetical protein